MSQLSPEQQKRAVEALHEYLAAPAGPEGVTPEARSLARDGERRKLIEETLKPLVDSFLTGSLPLDEFKTQIDGLNKRNTHWGFKGIKGQMFFNQVVNVADDPDECSHEIRAAIAAPTSDEIAKSRIRTFISYVKRLGDEHVQGGGTGYGRPKLGSVPFFLSYFWQIQDRDRWPVYYTNTVQMAEDLNLWRPGDDLAENYIVYTRLHNELAELFSKEAKKPFGLYEVEHVFWFKGGNPYSGNAAQVSEPKPDSIAPAPVEVSRPDGKLPESYVPPIVAVLSRMATNDPGLVTAAKASGTSLDRAFEKSIDAAFTILGYHTQLLGQGQGRVPDGLAIDQDNSYALIWDAKVRAGGYSMGTDDRTIREYIKTQSRGLKKRSLRNIYYLIVSSGFADDFDGAIREIKMETDVGEVCLLEAEGLVAMVDQKLRQPHQISLGPDGMQRLFSSSGVLSASEILETLA